MNRNILKEQENTLSQQNRATEMKGEFWDKVEITTQMLSRHGRQS